MPDSTLKTNASSDIESEHGKQTDGLRSNNSKSKTSLSASSKEESSFAHTRSNTNQISANNSVQDTPPKDKADQQSVTPPNAPNNEIRHEQAILELQNISLRLASLLETLEPLEHAQSDVVVLKKLKDKLDSFLKENIHTVDELQRMSKDAREVLQRILDPHIVSKAGSKKVRRARSVDSFLNVRSNSDFRGFNIYENQKGYYIIQDADGNQGLYPQGTVLYKSYNSAKKLAFVSAIKNKDVYAKVTRVIDPKTNKGIGYNWEITFNPEHTRDFNDEDWYDDWGRHQNAHYYFMLPKSQVVEDNSVTFTSLSQWWKGRNLDHIQHKREKTFKNLDIAFQELARAREIKDATYATVDKIEFGGIKGSYPTGRWGGSDYHTAAQLLYDNKNKYVNNNDGIAIEYPGRVVRDNIQAHTGRVYYFTIDGNAVMPSGYKEAQTVKFTFRTKDNPLFYKTGLSLIHI